MLCFLVSCLLVVAVVVAAVAASPPTTSICDTVLAGTPVGLFRFLGFSVVQGFTQAVRWFLICEGFSFVEFITCLVRAACGVLGYRTVVGNSKGCEGVSEGLELILRGLRRVLHGSR